MEPKGPGNFLSLGLLVSLKADGGICVRIPGKRWRSKLTVDMLIQAMRREYKEMNVYNFVTLLLERIRIYFKGSVHLRPSSKEGRGQVFLPSVTRQSNSSKIIRPGIHSTTSCCHG